MTKDELLKVAKPILFNTEMVKAILEGRKTVTRRCVKYKYNNTEMRMHTDKYGTRLIEIQKDVEGETHGKNPDGSTWHKLLPYIEKRAPFRKGDILYVRETWCDDRQFTHEDTPGIYFYKASADSNFEVKWKPSLHMPKEAARIFLKVTDVRVERLQDIDAIGCLQEGIESECPHVLNGEEKLYAFSQLWASTIKKDDIDTYGWDANPYVWVIEFERVEI